MTTHDPMRERIEAFNHARGGGVRVNKAGRGYTLVSGRTGLPLARLRPTGDSDKVQVLWWNGQRWGASGPFGIATDPRPRSQLHRFRPNLLGQCLTENGQTRA
jgi:hypothetical protein